MNDASAALMVAPQKHGPKSMVVEHPLFSHKTHIRLPWFAGNLDRNRVENIRVKPKAMGVNYDILDLTQVLTDPQRPEVVEADIIIGNDDGTAAGFHLRRVQPGILNGDKSYLLEVSHGLTPEQTVTTNSFVLARGDADARPVDARELHRRMDVFGCNVAVLLPESGVNNISAPRAERVNPDDGYTPIFSVSPTTGEIRVNIPLSSANNKGGLQIYVSSPGYHRATVLGQQGQTRVMR